MDAVAGLTRQDGLLPTYIDKDKGRILVALPPADADGVTGRFLYVTALKTGLGSAPVGLDRARRRRSEILVFRRVGQKVIAEYENPRFVAAGALGRRAGRGPRRLRHLHRLGRQGRGRHRRTAACWWTSPAS